MDSLFHIIHSVDVSLYHLFSAITGNWIIDRLVRIQEENFLLKSGVFIAAYWGFWFHPGPGQDRRRKAILAIMIAALLTIVVTRAIAAATPFQLRPIYDPSLEHHLSITLSHGLKTWNSFPSDTAGFIYALAFGLAYLSRRLSLPVFLYAAVWVCFPRLYLGFHYTSDVVVGAALGVVTTWLVLRTRWQQSRLLDRALAFVSAKPHIFYAAAFFVTIQMATMFDDVRILGVRLFHAARQMPQHPAILIAGVAIAALVVVVIAVTLLHLKLRAKAESAKRRSRFRGRGEAVARKRTSTRRRPARQAEEKQKRIEFLEKMVQTKDEVLVELMAEHIALRKSLGEL